MRRVHWRELFPLLLISNHNPGGRGRRAQRRRLLLIILLKDSTIAFYGAVISEVAIISLFFGQRMTKDYAGAAVLVPYFLLTLVAIYLFAQPVT